MKKILLFIWILALLPAVSLAEDAPLRAVCLYGSYAEAWLSAGGTLVGVTSDAVTERNLPLSEDIQIIGTNKEPNLELIVALDPDIVIASADIASQQTAVQALQDMGVRCESFRVDTYLDYAEMMRQFAAWTGNPLDEALTPMISQIENICADAAGQSAPTVLLLRAYSTGAKVKGADNLTGAMLRDLGCVNIAEIQPALLEELTLESIVAENPQHIFITVMGGDESAALSALDASLGANPAWQALDAVQQGNVHVLPKELFHYKPNARWAESYAYLYELLFQE